MIEIKGDIFDLMDEGGFDGLCITTNGFVKKNGECVMGRGIALECKKRWVSLPLILGGLIDSYGNHVYNLWTNPDSIIFSFPVKHNWWENADIELIKRSCNELMLEIDRNKLSRVLLPRPGCGNGRLQWEYVQPEIEPLLDNRIFIVTF